MTKKASQTTEDRFLNAALRALDDGLRPIPLWPGSKKPIVGWAVFQKRTPTGEEVTAWWTENPDANVAIVTGAGSGVDVIDFDFGHDPWPEEGRALPAECVVETPGGGSHYYIKHIDGLRGGTSKLAEHVDVRAEGGIIVIPPSVINEREYCYKTGNIIDAEEAAPWLREELLKSSTSSKPVAVGQVIREGTRNDTLASIAGTLRYRGLSEPVIREMLHTVNREQCDPPLPPNEVAGIASSISRYEPGGVSTGTITAGAPPGAGDGEEPTRTQAEQLTRLCEANIEEFVVDQFKTTYVVIPVNGHMELWPTSDRRFREAWMARLYREVHGKPPSSEALKQARIQVEAKCLIAEPRWLHNRVAWHDGEIVYDLSDGSWRGVAISPDGWRIVPLPMIFRRYSHQAPQVEPIHSGSIDPLWFAVNVAESDRRLMAGILASWFIPDIPHPVLILHGEPSTGKSTTTRRLKELVDPSVVPVLAMPKRAIDAYQLLDHHWVAPFDNVSALSDDMSDLLCRAVTGEGTSTRVLYTNDGDYIRRYRRCITINGVGNPAYRADLLDRAVIIETSPIANPRDERALDGAWLDARAGILGAVFDAVSEGMRTLSSVNLPHPPRMADFARWGMAFAPALGYTAQGFIDDYTAANRRRWQDVIDGSLFARALVALVTREGGAWNGTATELLQEVRALTDKKDAAGIPGSAKGVSTELDRLAAALRRVGVFAERKREGKDGQRIIVLTTDAQWKLW